MVLRADLAFAHSAVGGSRPQRIRLLVFDLFELISFYSLRGLVWGMLHGDAQVSSGLPEAACQPLTTLRPLSHSGTDFDKYRADAD